MTVLFEYSTSNCPGHEPMELFGVYMCRHCGKRMDAPKPKQQPRRGGVKLPYNRK